MKQCPECSSQYEDTINFCSRDGRSLVLASTAASRLCPHCANSIPEDAAQCPYCKAEVEASSSPAWHVGDEFPLETPPLEVDPSQRAEKTQKSVMPKIVLIVGILLCLIGAGMLGMGILRTYERGDGGPLLEEKTQELQAKDERIEVLEAELAKAREESTENTRQADERAAKRDKEAAANVKELAALRARLKESEGELEVAKQRLSLVNRELERVSAAQAQPRREPRAAGRVSTPAPAARRSSPPGVYETVKATAVYEQPSVSSRILSRIGGGTRVNVVRSDGDWLQVVSKRGNPPGFILRDDAMFVAASR